MTAPRWASALLRRLAPPGRAEDVLGDLHEVHLRRVQRDLRLIAYALTALDTLDLAFAFFRQRIRRRKPASLLQGPGPNLSGYGGDNSWRSRMLHTIESWARDFMHAVRSLRRAPGFTAVVVATLGLAIGANTAIFTVVNAVLIDPLPFPNADRLVSIRASAPGTDMPEEFGVSWDADPFRRG